MKYLVKPILIIFLVPQFVQSTPGTPLCGSFTNIVSYGGVCLLSFVFRESFDFFL